MDAIETKTALETFFEKYRNNILGIDQSFVSPYGEKKIIYTDWTASGRLYRPIEEKMLHLFGPYVANTHTETTVSGTTMTRAYHTARKIIKKHINASENDVLITTGTGMTGVVNKFQRILGLKVPESMRAFTNVPDNLRPVVFVSHMEHHSNQTSWLETIAKVEVIPCNQEGLFCINEFKILMDKYKDHPYKIASITSCSNVTGIKTPYHEVAKIMHQNNGLCFVDFACSGPYIHIDMHPENDEDSYLDAVFLSPHKFLGGPGTSGVLVFNKKLYKNLVPDCPGGGTVAWTTPWGTHQYLENIEEREDGGTPGFLQVIRTSLAIRLKEEMGVENILAREEELLDVLFERLGGVAGISILAPHVKKRLGVFSFNIDGLHHDLTVKILNDRFGIQSRGGCSCAGTYGHYLLEIDQQRSSEILESVNKGICDMKPGWVRVSIHPTTTNEELHFVIDSILALVENVSEWKKDYKFDGKKYSHQNETKENSSALCEDWFDF
ncbi:MAG: aminotransferase class V-fold PLP-dependent enzyme [Patiriisocius sp.]|uniref:aminotransferase class V-fold PLP-dependent enzyme n=1 Tax=Patiriisocius sp. TaxID=2822396 RepID=UPI003EF39E17